MSLAQAGARLSLHPLLPVLWGLNCVAVIKERFLCSGAYRLLSGLVQLRLKPLCVLGSLGLRAVQARAPELLPRCALIQLLTGHLQLPLQGQL